MNDFDKQFQDKLGQKQSPLSGQEHDALWDSISTQLDADDIKTKHKRSRRRIAGYAVLAVIVASLRWISFSTTESPIIANEIQRQAKSSDAAAPEVLSNPFIQNVTAVGGTSELSTNTGGNTGGSFQAAATNYKESAATEPHTVAVKERVAKNASFVSTADQPPPPAEVTFEVSTASTMMDLLLFMNLQNPPKSTPLFAAGLAPIETSSDEKNNDNRGTERCFNFRMHQGPTWSKFRYVEQDENDLLTQNNNIKSNGSWSAGGMIEFDAFRQRWGVGIEWNEFIHQLNYKGTFERINTIDDALLQVELDSNTGDTLSAVYGAAEVLVLAQRRVVHHNRLRTIAIPVEWQKQWSLTPILHGGIALGAIFHWRTSVSGRTFTEQEGDIADYSDSEFPSNRIAVAPVFRMQATYDIAPDWSIQLSARIASMNLASRLGTDLPDQAGQFKGRLLTGNLSFGVARFIRY
jgi:hypothetical protein